MQIINVEGLGTERKTFELSWHSVGGNIISVLIIVVLLTIFWLGASAVFSKDKVSIERYETQLTSLTTTQTNKVFNEITTDPKSTAAAEADFKELAGQIRSLKTPESLRAIHKEYIELYDSFSADIYWGYQNNHAKDHLKIASTLEGQDGLWKKHDKDWSEAKKRFTRFNEQLDSLNLKLIDLIE